MPAPWFKFYAGDFLADSKIRLLTDEQVGQLVKLWAFNCKDGSIPSDLAIASRLLGVSPSANIGWVVNFFTVDQSSPDTMSSPRMRMEQAAYAEKCEKLRLSAARGGKKKAENALANATPNAIANTLAKPAESESESESEKITTPLPPKKKKQHREEDRIDSAVPKEIIDAVDAIVDSTPSVDREGRKIRAVKPVVLIRLQEILATKANSTPELLTMAWKDYLASDPKSIKAPQYFFGKAEDQGPNGANWYPWAKAIFVRRQMNGVPA